MHKLITAQISIFYMLFGIEFHSINISTLVVITTTLTVDNYFNDGILILKGRHPFDHLADSHCHLKCPGLVSCIPQSYYRTSRLGR